MALKDLPSHWPEYLDIAIKHLNDRILPSLKYSPNELLLGLIVNSHRTDSPEDIRPPTKQEVALHLALVEQQQPPSSNTAPRHYSQFSLYFSYL